MFKISYLIVPLILFSFSCKQRTSSLQAEEGNGGDADMATMEKSISTTIEFVKSWDPKFAAALENSHQNVRHVAYF